MWSVPWREGRGLAGWDGTPLCRLGVRATASRSLGKGLLDASRWGTRGSFRLTETSCEQGGSMRALLDRLMAHLGYVPKRLMDEALAERLRFQVALHCKLVGSTTVCTLPCQLGERQRLHCHAGFLAPSE